MPNPRDSEQKNGEHLHALFKLNSCYDCIIVPGMKNTKQIWDLLFDYLTTAVSNQSTTIVILPLPPPPQFCFILSDVPELKPEPMTRASNNPKCNS